MASELKWVGIAGPTASGKTAAALAIARQRPVEIVSVDSALVYRGMDIGTAKPTSAERASVPHHLIDIRDPLQAYSAAEFAADATRLIADIQSRGKLPLLVGGTMLYYKTLVDGIDPMPPADAALRTALDAEAVRIGWPAMHARLAAVDPLTAARLSPNDAQRIQRALEVHQSSGRPLSAFHTRAQRGTADVSSNALLMALEPSDRGWLHARIAERFDLMLEGGLMDEVHALRARGDLSPALASMRCVGYRQVWEALDDASAPWTPAQLQTVRDKGIAATRQLAKRQLTWLRSMPQRRVVACDAPDALQQVLNIVHEDAI